MKALTSFVLSDTKTIKLSKTLKRLDLKIRGDFALNMSSNSINTNIQ